MYGALFYGDIGPQTLYENNSKPELPKNFRVPVENRTHDLRVLVQNIITKWFKTSEVVHRFIYTSAQLCFVWSKYA